MASRRGWWQGTGAERSEPSAPTDLVERTFNSRPERIARSEARRAARRGQTERGGILVARPDGSGAIARAAAELADARVYTWVRTDAVARALDEGNSSAATEIVEDLLRTEQAIWVMADHMSVPPQWQHLADELSAASDTVTDALRAQLRALDGPSQLGHIRAGQSRWIRAWRSFVLILTPGT